MRERVAWIEPEARAEEKEEEKTNELARRI
jgi:hypothetical protein